MKRSLPSRERGLKLSDDWEKMDVTSRSPRGSAD